MTSNEWTLRFVLRPYVRLLYSRQLLAQVILVTANMLIIFQANIGLLSTLFVLALIITTATGNAPLLMVPYRTDAITLRRL